MIIKFFTKDDFIYVIDTYKSFLLNLDHHLLLIIALFLISNSCNRNLF